MASLIDQRVLGKPSSFNGEEKDWPDFDFSFINWMGCLIPEADSTLEMYLDRNVCLGLDEMTEEVQQLAKTLYLILTQLVKGKALTLVKSVVG